MKISTTNASWQQLALPLLAMVGCMVCLASVAGFSSSSSSRYGGDFDDASRPSELAAATWSLAVAHGNQSGRNATEAPCTPRSVESFPPDLFSLSAKRHGAILVHVLASVWLFTALAIVCDQYFVASLQVVCNSLGLKPDVAGATFMAAGSSAPELLAAVIGVFVARSDVGVSTIVGSAIFNNLMIVSLCGLAATGAVYLSWWPLFRDCGFYSLSVAALIAIIHDGAVTWYESCIQLALFFLYLAVMFFNNRIDAAISSRYPSLATGGAKRLHEAAQPQPSSDHSNDLGNDLGDDLGDDDLSPVIADIAGGRQQPQQRMRVWSVDISMSRAETAESGSASPSATVVIHAEPESPFRAPAGRLQRALWLFTLPWAAAFFATIPDCRVPGWRRRLFIVTFLSSVLWISGLIYMLVWMVCAVGDAAGLPDTVMGLTLLSIGACVPDAMAGIFVAKSGLADMAIANSIASNVFDITACLGLPWFISTAVLSPGSTVVISSSGLTYTSITLLSTIIFLLVAVHMNRMLVDKKLGLICMAVYLAVVTFACLYETNVFGPLNPPSCPRVRL